MSGPHGRRQMAGDLGVNQSVTFRRHPGRAGCGVAHGSLDNTTPDRRTPRSHLGRACLAFGRFIVET
jgi:hypothetical protein